MLFYKLLFIKTSSDTINKKQKPRRSNKKMFVIENEYFLIAKKFLRLIIMCFWVLFMVSKKVLINERLKRNINELKSNLELSNQ